jgi:hypothetical protein
MKVSFELLDVASVLLVLFGAVPFGVSKSPKSVAFYEEWSKKLAKPGIGIKLYRRVSTVHIILLEVSPT